MVPTATSTPGGSGGAYLWGRSFGGTGADLGQVVASDKNRNVLLAGSFRGTVDFGGGAMTSAGEDIFVAKYSATGAHVWSKHFGNTGFNRAEAVAVDSVGNVVVVGHFTGTVNFGGGPLTSMGGSDIFVAKFTAAGAHVWSKAMGNGQDDAAYAVAVDKADNAIVTGTFLGRVDFGGGILTGWARDTFVAKYSASGAHVWSKNFSTGGGTSTGYGVAADGDGNVVVVGFLLNQVNFGGGPVSSVASSDDIFMAKYSSTGAYLWAKTFGDTHDDVAEAVAVDANNNIVLTGYFYGPVDFGGGSVASNPWDTFVARFSPAGTYLWAREFGAVGSDSGHGVAVDGLGNVVVVGEFRGTVDFGTGPTTGPGNQDIFAAKYSPSGVPLWAEAFGGSSDDAALAGTADVDGNVVLAGLFTATADFGGFPLVSAGSTDIPLLKLAP